MECAIGLRKQDRGSFEMRWVPDLLCPIYGHKRRISRFEINRAPEEKRELSSFKEVLNCSYLSR